MRGLSNGARGLASPDKCEKKRGVVNNNNSSHHQKNKNGNSTNDNSSIHHKDKHHDSSGSDDAKKGGSSAGSDAVAADMWPPKFVIPLTNKEKEEDFMAIKGSKLPQRPKKRAKIIQRTLNLVSPGAWLCDLTLERYEVREKKVTKKRSRGLKAMENLHSDLE